MTQLRRGRWTRSGVVVVAAGVLALGVAACGAGTERVTVGLITKQETNPYWVTMREIAQDEAGEHNVELLTATGQSDVDVESQIEALERMTAEGADGILIAPTDSEAVVPAIEQAREAGVIVIAVDTPTDPADAVDAFFGTNNLRAGELIGAYAQARADRDGVEPRIAMLDLAPGIESGDQRHEGFLEGFGIQDDDEQIVGSVETQGDEERARAGLEELLTENPDINVVYTVNEPAAFGAIAALEAAGTSMDDVIVVSVDGGCEAVKNGVRPGDIDATAQQFPENMAREGVRAIAQAVRGEAEPPSGYLDTGVRLITGDRVPGVESEDVAFGVRNCWGD
ncbi:substrate-binding domain-containing protein [Georgenia sp. EYE_87]|uniref:substrate-binding domain-containing protein n=1 Tax=Georgenia sp. EYE_87 TaxID=2853448 RepID=UPI0020047A2D|nr:substrate-binding domain-containing protein [Georgenia sp. EYE_87]MCK6211414.1 substrate-binding domain-containing protein [Georgenia sp. EYE_87]